MSQNPAREFPPPIPNSETDIFWDAAREGRFLVKHCTSCEKAHWYPREVCPFCDDGGQTVWKEISGSGTIYTYSVMRRVSTPFVTAYVTLDEGPTLLTNIIDCDFDMLAIGAKVHATFVRSQDELYFVPVFKLEEKY